jgi:cytochrome c biogenesis protein CcmG/thiol:disulfide interchange protein DsbE
MRFLLPVLVLAALLGLLYVGLGKDPREIPSPLVGKPAPAFSLSVLGSNSTFTEKDLRGQATLVNFFASWCGGCITEHPFLMQLKQQGVKIIGIDYKDEDSAAQSWLTEHGGNPYQLILADRAGNVGIDWGVYGVPETFVLNAQGTIIYKHIGPLDVAGWAKIAPLMGR